VAAWGPGYRSPGPHSHDQGSPELFVETLGDRQCVVGAAADYVVVVVVADYVVVVEAGTFESGCYGGKAVGSDVVVVADDVVVVVDDVVWPVGSVVAVVECQNALNGKKKTDWVGEAVFPHH